MRFLEHRQPAALRDLGSILEAFIEEDLSVDQITTRGFDRDWRYPITSGYKSH